MAVKRKKASKKSTAKKTYAKLTKTALAKEAKTYANSRVKLKKYAALRKKYGTKAASRIVKAAHKLKEKHGKSTKKGQTRKTSRPAYTGLKKKKKTTTKRTTKKKSSGRVKRGKSLAAKMQREANAMLRSSKGSSLKTACKKFFKTAKTKKRAGKTISAWSQWVAKCSKLSGGKGGVTLASKVAKAAKCGPYAPKK